MYTDATKKMKGRAVKRLAGVLAHAQRWSTLISAAILISEQPGQRALQQCWDSAGSWCTSISVAMISKRSGKRGFELRGVVKPLALLVCRHLALLALCHLFCRQATRKSDI
jgi:CHASE2 domain-containing sensor protein